MKNDFFTSLSDAELATAYAEYQKFVQTGFISEKDGGGYLRRAIDTYNQNTGRGIIDATFSLLGEIAVRWANCYAVQPEQKINMDSLYVGQPIWYIDTSHFSIINCKVKEVWHDIVDRTLNFQIDFPRWYALRGFDIYDEGDWGKVVFGDILHANMALEELKRKKQRKEDMNV